MNKIGFKNFRRFVEMPAIELGGVNMFVGGNNAGKSTVVKAMLLIINFLKYAKQENGLLKYRFDIGGAYDVNIDSFDNAICWEKREDGYILFNISIDHFDVSISIIAPTNTNGETYSHADINYVEVEDTLSKLKLKYEANKITLCTDGEDLSSKKEELLKRRSKLETDLHAAKKKAEKEGDGKNPRQIFWEKGSFFETVSAINREMNEIDMDLDILSTQSALTDISIPVPAEFKQGYSIVSKFICAFIDRYKENIDKLDKRTVEYKEKAQFKETLPIMLPDLSVLDRFAEQFDDALSNLNIEYLSAHAASQQFLFNKRDENDYVAQSIHEFYNLRITEGSTEFDNFLLPWLQKFEVAEGIQIKRLVDCSYTCQVCRNGHWTDIANLGRGSIQVIVLLIRLASIIKRFKGKGAIVLVEEPEQNLHPKLQSFLTELFYGICAAYGLRFIVETHSEYLVRMSQVIVGDETKKDSAWQNPFKVYFFCSNGVPKNIGFSNVGEFVDEFEAGFYSEASRLDARVMNNLYDSL